MISGKEIKVLDRNSEFCGVPAINLMENAGKGVADFIKQDLKQKYKEILVFCGIGNNGGDGLVASRYLSEFCNVEVFLTGKENEIKTSISKENFKKLKKTNTKIFDIKSIESIDELVIGKEIIIDSMLGIGLSGNLREPYLSIVKKINSLKERIIVSVDVPTGLGTNNSIKPDYTVTFHDIKIGMNKQNSGNVKIVDIGIPKKAIEYIGPGELVTYYPRPKLESHKGDNGVVLVVGGGPYIGAPAMSGLASLRTGSDLTFVTTPKKAARAMTSFSPELIKPLRLAKDTSKLSPNLIVKELNDEDNLITEDINIIEKYLPKSDSVIIGPGLGSENQTKIAIKKLIEKCVRLDKSMVIDADAIQVVGKNPEIIKNSKTVITPHAGEFKELTNESLDDNIEKRKQFVKKWAKKFGVTIILKGPIDIISNGKDVKLNDIHNQAMTVGGTGDVLAGIIGSLLSKNVEPFNAARIGVFINGSAGNNSFKKYSYGLIATDMIHEIPNILKKYL
jgi:NAD(P)H-hydrate epimerase